MAYRESFESCPRCGVALEDAGDVRACAACRGQWVLEPVLAEMVLAMLPAGVIGKLTLEPIAEPSNAIACPTCGTKMDPVSMYGVALDRCPKQHGVWFDPDELQAGLRRAADPARHRDVPSAPPAIPSDELGFTFAPDEQPRREPTTREKPLITIAPIEEPAPIVEPAAPPPAQFEPATTRPPSPNPSMETIVTRLKNGERFHVGDTVYRWNATKDKIAVEYPSFVDTMYPTQLYQVVAQHPEAFGGRHATLAEVIARMKCGDRIQRGGGRIFNVFGWDPTTRQLYSDEMCDGDETREPCSEARLAEALAKAPQIFADIRDKDERQVTAAVAKVVSRMRNGEAIQVGATGDGRLYTQYRWDAALGLVRDEVDHSIPTTSAITIADLEAAIAADPEAFRRRIRPVR